MKSIFRALVTALFFSIATIAVFAQESRPLSDLVLPAPEGFERVTQSMSTVVALNQSNAEADSLNELVASYIADDQVALALAGEMPDMSRYFSIKVNKEFRQIKVSDVEFEDIAHTIKLQNEQSAEQIEYQISREEDNENLSLKERIDLGEALKVSTIVPLEVHHSEEHFFSHSMFINYGGQAGETVSDDIVSATLTFVNLDGTVLFLYAYAPQEELNWTREASLEWVRNVLKENGVAQISRDDTTLLSPRLMVLLACLMLVAVTGVVLLRIRSAA